MFKFDAKWDVDKTAESLNTSLFGRPKKHKLTETSGPASLDKSYATPVLDSDDEQYTKKDKKKLKKWKKKNKVHDKRGEMDSTKLNQNYDVDDMTAGAKKSVNSGGKTTDRSGRKQKVNASPIKMNSNIANAKLKKVNASPIKMNSNIANAKLKKVNAPPVKMNSNIANAKLKKVNAPPVKMNSNIANAQPKKVNASPVKMNSNIANAQPKKVKKDNKLQEPKLHTPSHGELTEKKSKKRKRSPSQSADDVVGNKNKMAKVEEHNNSTVANGDVADSGEGKSKRKRNRKKKNNSKKNKYKHLALNPKKSGNSDIPQGSGSISPNLEPTDKKSSSHTLKLNSDKSFEFIHEHINIVTLSDKTLVQKQDTNEDNHTNSFATDLQVKNKSKKRKNVQDSHTAPIKKLKQNKNNSKDETSIMNVDIQSATRTSKSGEQNSTKSYVSLKNNMKQQVLLKLLNGKQNKKQDSSNVSNKKDSTSNKKERKMLGENGGSTDKSKNSGEKGNKQESFSEDAHKKPLVQASPAFNSIWGKAAELGQQAKERLDSARFRYINEQLYSCTGVDALQLFREDKTAFSVYHEGFQNQVNKWPVNPLDVFIKQIKDKPKNLVIADFGCGDAKLAFSIPQKVHSFDLVALNNRITVCDMSKTPLPGEHVDIAVFCLSLMGTNITDYILEANRVLKTGGLLKIAEVVSRFSGLSRFIEGVCNCGFQLLNKRDTNQMFYLLDFKKIKPIKKSAPVGQIKLKPCIYKRR